jgi:hypothetical protein
VSTLTTPASLAQADRPAVTSRRSDTLRSVLRSIITASVVSLTALTGCGSPPPTKMTPVSPDPDGVAANSASEQRLNSGKPPPATPDPVDPSQPYTTPVNGDGSGAPSSAPGSVNNGSAANATGGKAGGKGGKGPVSRDPTDPKGTAASASTAAGGGKVSKAECKALFDKFIDLSIGGDSRFEGIPPEMVQQMKASALAQAQSEKGDPCSTQDVSRQQYNCAIVAPTSAAWQRCMK